jgi:hypothetical protein
MAGAFAKTVAGVADAFPLVFYPNSQINRELFGVNIGEVRVGKGFRYLDNGVGVSSAVCTQQRQVTSGHVQFAFLPAVLVDGVTCVAFCTVPTIKSAHPASFLKSLNRPAGSQQAPQFKCVANGSFAPD